MISHEHDDEALIVWGTGHGDGVLCLSILSLISSDFMHSNGQKIEPDGGFF